MPPHGLRDVAGNLFDIDTIEIWAIGGASAIKEGMKARTENRSLANDTKEKARKVDKAAFLGHLQVRFEGGEGRRVAATFMHTRYDAKHAITDSASNTTYTDVWRDNFRAPNTATGKGGVITQGKVVFYSVCLCYTCNNSNVSHQHKNTISIPIAPS